MTRTSLPTQAGSLLELGLGLCATLDLETAASVVGPLEEGSYQVPWARASACVALAVNVPTGVPPSLPYLQSSEPSVGSVPWVVWY